MLYIHGQYANVANGKIFINIQMLSRKCRCDLHGSLLAIRPAYFFLPAIQSVESRRRERDDGALCHERKIIQRSKQVAARLRYV